MRENGLAELVEGYKKDFKILENTDYYLKEDYKSAEKKYIRFRRGMLYNNKEK